MVAYNFAAQQFSPEYGSSHKQMMPCKKVKVVIADSATEPTKDGRGGMLVFTLRCIEGPLNGQEQIDRLNLHNVNSTAVEIANKQLSAYCHVLGVYNIADTQQLHNIPFMIDVDWQKGNAPSQEKPEGGYTEVKAIYDANGNPPGKAGQGRPQGQQAPAPTPPAANVAPASPAPTNWGNQPAPNAPAPTPNNGNGGWQGNNNNNGGWGNR